MLAGVLTGAGLLADWSGIGGAWTPRILHLAAVASGCWLFLPAAGRALVQLAPDMNLLMAIAVAGALLLGDWAEGAAVTFLFALAETLEEFASRRSRRALHALVDLAPDTALVLTGRDAVDTPVAAIAVGATVRVRNGERVPLDGEVVAGASDVNQAPITGESLPVAKAPGAVVYAGSINGEGSLEIRVTRAAGDTTLDRIVRLVEEAQEEKAPAQRFVDRFARYYTPVVFGAAVLVATLPPLVFGAAGSLWFYRALVLLVIACPCALVISTPVAVVTALTMLARRGVLVKGGAHLEALGRLQALAIDKTGTITEGRPRLLETHVLAPNEEATVLQVAAGIESHSGHPFAQAVISATRDRGYAEVQATDYKAHTGRGAEGRHEGHRFFVGNHRFTHELGVCSPAIEERVARIEGQGRSAVVVGHAPHETCPGEVLGLLAMGDRMRPAAPAAIRALQAAGIKRIVMLSGDNRRTAEAVARDAGIKEVRAELLPEDKVTAVREMLAQHRAVGMVGDGINDAPALALATVGIAMGAVGADSAIETADVALMNDDLGKVAEAIHVGRRALNMIRANIAFAIGVKVLFLTLAVSGYSSLWLAIFADTGVTMLVIANSLRLLRPDRWLVGATA